MPRLLDLFCGRFGWSKAFAARGWECVGIDLVEPPERPEGCAFLQWDISFLTGIRDYKADFICASSPCEQFSMHGMKHFHPNPPYPELGIRLFNHTRSICEASGVPYVMENVRSAQQFVGNAVHHCGPFYLWGTGVPPIMSQGVSKGISQAVPIGIMMAGRSAITEWRRKHDPMWSSSRSDKRKQSTALAATIPPELSNCVADYAERLLEPKQSTNIVQPAPKC